MYQSNNVNPSKTEEALQQAERAVRIAARQKYQKKKVLLLVFSIVMVISFIAAMFFGKSEAPLLDYETFNGDNEIGAVAQVDVQMLIPTSMNVTKQEKYYVYITPEGDSGTLKLHREIYDTETVQTLISAAEEPEYAGSSYVTFYGKTEKTPVEVTTHAVRLMEANIFPSSVCLDGNLEPNHKVYPIVWVIITIAMVSFFGTLVLLIQVLRLRKRI